MLVVENVSSRFAGALKIDDVSMQVGEGEFVSILGANGAGKTSLLGLITGRYAPSSGRILLEGKEITGWPAHRVVRAGIALAPQNHPIFTSLTVDENLAVGGTNPDIDVFALFPNLERYRKALAGRLSGGERQMLSMALALGARPRVVVFDEPSSGLAPKIIAQVFEAIRRLADTGMTIVMVEQNASQALRISDRAYVLEHGRVVLHGASAEISENDHVRQAYLGV
ncbi:ABC transporter ATP-binding protein [Roseovarius amoyensis]|uniref:ABC transporter ATP-binding protein n=1 Tax=Roseovarius amoyensis TaxID=2211448 RepID=UPI000DBE4687|nr:ABC transporter ATP-binding protein [Roseovarius amoyensis]